MRKYFLIITSAERAWVGLIAALVGFLMSVWTPLPVRIALLTLVLPVGVFSFAYLVVYTLWPATSAHLPKFKQWVHVTAASIPSRLKGGKSKSLPRLGTPDSAAFFAQRFAEAFPGVRQIHWYEQREAVKRLKTLLQEPLVFKNDHGYTTPIWWWRDGNLQIPSFRVLSKDTVLLDTKELQIKRIAAVPSSEYYRAFVYIEAAPMKPCGAYEWNEEKIQQWISGHGYAWEEYGLHKGKHVVSRSEFDDNAAVIRGKLVRLDGDVELRERYITPYNLVIAPHLSPINNTGFDSKLRALMDRLLTGDAEISELKEEVRHLPKPRAWGE